MKILSRKTVFILGVFVMILGLFGCGKPKYKLILDDYGFKSDKKAYAQGDKVTVYYDMIATDTDYSFFTDSEDVDLKEGYDDAHGYILSFDMPAHDVTVKCSSRNTMEYDPDSMAVSNDPEDLLEEANGDNIVFDYFEKTVAVEGEDEHIEYVLYSRNFSDDLILVRYIKENGEPEKADACVVPSIILTDCMVDVEKYEMGNWKGGEELTGKLYVVKYKDNGEMKRVTSENMPEDGMEAFGEIYKDIISAWNNYYLE